MQTTASTARLVTTLAAAAMALAALAAAGNARAEGADYRNVTTGGPLKPGIYGRIALRNPKAPPPIIYEQPVVAAEALVPAGAQPVYLYVPPGQVRKWKQHCGKWSACEQPVLFVRVDDSPSRWGDWKKLREQVALHRP
jgi:hypothetical protein